MAGLRRRAEPGQIRKQEPLSPVVVAADGLELAARAWPALRTATVVAAAAAVVVVVVAVVSGNHFY